MTELSCLCFLGPSWFLTMIYLRTSHVYFTTARTLAYFMGTGQRLQSTFFFVGWDAGSLPPSSLPPCISSRKKMAVTGGGRCMHLPRTLVPLAIHHWYEPASRVLSVLAGAPQLPVKAPAVKIVGVHNKRKQRWYHYRWELSIHLLEKISFILKSPLRTLQNFSNPNQVRLRQIVAYGRFACMQLMFKTSACCYTKTYVMYFKAFSPLLTNHLNKDK